MQDRMKLNSTAIILLVLSFCITTFAQMKPYEVYNNSPAQMVAFSSDTQFEDAINILGKLSMQFESKTIIDPTFQSGPIGIEIPQMPWKTAFQRIVSERNLEFSEFPNYYQIIEKGQEGGQTVPAKTDGPIYNSKTREVKINAIFFQADRTKLHNAGINWEVLQTSPGLSLRQLTIGSDFGIISTQSSSDDASAKRRITHTSYEEDGSVDVEAILNLFESKDMGKILSKPTIKVVDGKQGEIHVGTQFAINQRDFAGNTVTRFANAGTILRVTPQIIEDSSMTFIHMTIEAEKSSARAGMGDRPEIDTQKATTDVLLTDGEQTMIGGLFVQEKVENRSGIPILKDLPWWVFGIRYLAGYTTTTVSRKELLIFIKVELVSPLKDRIEKKRQELLSQQLTESSNQFRDEFNDLDAVATDIVRKSPSYPLKEEKYKKNDIEEKIDEELKQEAVVSEVEEPVMEPEPIIVPEKPVKETPAVDKDTKQIIQKLTEEEQQSTHTQAAVINKPAEEPATKSEERKTATQETQKIEEPKSGVTPEIEKTPPPPPPVTVKKETKTVSQPVAVKPAEPKPVPKKVEEPVVKQVEETVSSQEEKKPEPQEPLKVFVKPEPKPVVTKTEEPKETVSVPQESPAETVEQSNINDEPSLKPRYTIQIFSSDNYEKTMEEISLFKEKGIEVYIVKQKVDDKIFYRVRSGKYRNFSDAKRDMKNIQKTFPDRKDMWIDNL
ncbi:MAG: SPOR domain-containing protein [Candidatus Marinimicrobia bacterium]|nr:SPOR domain-containing protein [Candidatus Neomarinimicrobiota bacterium]